MQNSSKKVSDIHEKEYLQIKIHVVDKSKFNFLNKLGHTDKNSVLNECLYVFKQFDSCRHLYDKYDACVGDIVCSCIVHQNFFDGWA